MKAAASLLKDPSAIAWINILALVMSSIIFTVFYIRSVQPASREQNNNCKDAYQLCARDRLISGVFMTIASFNYIIYCFFPLPIADAVLPWPYWASVAIATAIGLPCSYLMYRGVVDAGEETMIPKKDHQLYGGIYRLIRHPQAAGEMPLWWAFAFLLNSPFLVEFSCLYVPIWIIFCHMEEKDLIIRYGSSYEQYRQHTGFFFPKRKTVFSKSE